MHAICPAFSCKYVLAESQTCQANVNPRRILEKGKHKDKPHLKPGACCMSCNLRQMSGVCPFSYEFIGTFTQDAAAALRHCSCALPCTTYAWTTGSQTAKGIFPILAFDNPAIAIGSIRSVAACCPEMSCFSVTCCCWRCMHLLS